MADINDIVGLGELLKLAERRARIALDKANLAEQRFQAALRNTQHARDEMVAMQDSAKRDRGERITRLLDAPASQIQLSQVRIAYEVDAQRLMAQRHKIAVLKEEEGARQLELTHARAAASEARKREQKLSEALADLKRANSSMEEFLSEMESER